ncbi:MAG: MFS transporter [Candidatus Aminicenantes bacterium]|nr:MFS transporter [Candidatus Aminicenantes bacterium]
MSEGPFYRILKRLADVKPEESRVALRMFFHFFLITASAYVIKAVNTSLFLQHAGARRLPYAYIITAVVMGFAVSWNSQLLQRLNRRLYISLSLVFFIACLFLFWFLFDLGDTSQIWEGWYTIYYFWSSIFLAASITQFWILVNDIMQPRQFRRLIGFFVNGGLLGGIVGSLLARFLAKPMGTHNLLLLCPGFLVVCLWIVQKVPKIHPDMVKETGRPKADLKKQKVGYLQSLKILTKHRYLIILSGMMLAGFVVSTLMDTQFNAAVQKTFSDPDQKTIFMGTFSAGLLVVSYFLNVLLTNRVLKNFGIRVALLVSPAILMLGVGSLFFVPWAGLMAWAVVVKGADKSLTHTFSQSTRELLYIPIPPDIKYKAKVFIDMFINKLADALAGILLLILAAFGFALKKEITPESMRAMKAIGVLTVAFILLWIFLVLLIIKEYVGIVRKNLRVKWPDADKFVAEKIDVDMTKLVFDTLESRQRSSVLYAMNMFDLIKNEKLSPELKKILSYKSAEVQACSLDTLLELDGEALVPALDDSIEEESLDADIREIMSMDVYQELMKEHIDKVTSGVGAEPEVSQMEVAKILGIMDPASPLIQNLAKLLTHESSEVVRYALESAGKQKKREFVPLIVPHLTKPALREAAVQTLIAYGGSITGTLRDYLVDPDVDIVIRKAIPDILARIGHQRAADLLATELPKGHKDVEAEMIEGMYKMKSLYPQVEFRDREILPEIRRLIKKSYLLLIELNDLKKDKQRAVLTEDLEKNFGRALKQIFELLSLVYSHDDMIRAYQNICSGSRKSIDYSVELLDNLLKKEVKEALLPLIEDSPLEDKARSARKYLKALEKSEQS